MSFSPTFVRPIVATGLVALAVPVVQAGAATLVVAPGGPYVQIQDAIDAAVGGDVVIVADGIWSGPGNRALDYDGKAITVRSASDDPTACVIDCEDADLGVRFTDAEGAGAVLRGIGIRNGTALYGGGIYIQENAQPTIRNVRIESCTASYGGGGIAIRYGAQPSIADTTISGCIAVRGGGLFADWSAAPSLENVELVANHATLTGGGVFLELDAEIALVGCTFDDNDAGFFGGGAIAANGGAVVLDGGLLKRNTTDGNGGAIRVAEGAMLSLDGTIVRANGAVGDGGGIHADSSTLELRSARLRANEAASGGGLSVSGGDVWLDGVRFESNVATSVGGGLYAGAAEVVGRRIVVIDNDANDSGGMAFHDGAAVRIDDARVLGNTATVAAGGLGVWDSDVTLCNALLSGNSTEGSWGGGITFITGTLRIVNSTVTGNAAGSGAGHGLHAHSGGPVYVVNSIFWGNGVDLFDEIYQFGTVSAINSCIAHLGTSFDYLAATDCIDDDPLMVDPAGPDGTYGTEDDDVHLDAASPAIDAGDQTLLPSDGTDLDDDGYEAERLPLDLDDADRVLGGEVDMGAYESSATAGGPDLDHDGLVGFPDLLIVLTAWGTAGSPADLDGSGTVDFGDVVMVLAAWTP